MGKKLDDALDIRILAHVGGLDEAKRAVASDLYTITGATTRRGRQ